MTPKPAKPVHAPIRGFQSEGANLMVGGRPIGALADSVGGTPFFAYERRLIEERVAELRDVLPSQIQIHYAVKANPMKAVVDCLAGLVDGFDVASAHELSEVLDTSIDPGEVSFAGPGKSKAELAQAVAAGVVINVESETELAAITALAGDADSAPRVAIRVNPDFELKSAGLHMGGGATQFGIDAERVPNVLAGMDASLLRFEGFHMFWGSQNLKVDAIADAQEKVVDLAVRLAPHAPGPVRTLNIGGGLGIPYFPGETPLDLPALGARMSELVARAADALPGTRLVIELGRYLIGEAGIYVCRVVDRKESRGKVFLVTDGGLHHHLSASGNLGQIIRRNFPLAVGTGMDRTEMETVNVVGCLCTPFDILAGPIDLPKADIGDLIVVFQSGAYGPTASPSAFLGHPPAIEILV